jgi:ribosomal protein S27E
MTPTPQQPEFTPVRCPECNAVFFHYSGSSPFRIRIKCRRCSTRKKQPVYVLLTISLEPILSPDIDLVTENLASA